MATAIRPLACSRKSIPSERRCAHCSALVAPNSGFYGFAHFEAVMKGETFHWLAGLYEAQAGPQQPTRKSDMTARFDVCASCLAPFLLQRFASLQRDNAKGADEALHLPDHTMLSPDETTAAVRLARLMRSDQNWLGFFIQWLLQCDAELTYDISPKEVQKMLEKMVALENWTDYLENLKREIPCISRHRALAWIPPDATVVPDEEDDQFYELLRLWRLEHPEPERRGRLHHPAGHLGLEESDD